MSEERNAPKIKITIEYVEDGVNQKDVVETDQLYLIGQDENGAAIHEFVSKGSMGLFSAAATMAQYRANEELRRREMASMFAGMGFGGDPNADQVGDAGVQEAN